MKFEFSELKQTPAWILLILIGSICVILGAAQQVTLAGNSIQLLRPYNLIVLGAGGLFILIGILELRKGRSSTPHQEAPAKQVVVKSIDVSGPEEYPRVRLTGKIDPPAQGIKIWILREHLSNLTGNFHVGARPALTDKDGEWQQVTHLWKGSFRIHAVVAQPNAEMLFSYYREAFEHARNVYRETTDKNAPSFPGWPNLKALPSGCVSDYKMIVL